MNVILSIKPKYARKILDGEKLFEFRKKVFKRNDIDRVYLYATSPICRLLGFFTYSSILEGTPVSLWEKTKKFSGISHSEYFNYFFDTELAFAIKIDKVVRFIEPLDPKKTLNPFSAPQSFMYTEFVQE